jgi:opacity protein-like surface antigen
MKGFSLLLAVALLHTGAAGAAARQPSATDHADAGASAGGMTQPPPTGPGRLARGDASGQIGWYTVHKGDYDSYNDWLGDSFYAGIGAGWYWTDHLKTEVQYGGSSEVRLYTSVPIVISGTQIFASSRYTFRTRRVTLGQVYQFGRNEWFHPYLGGGLDVVWERTTREDEHVTFFDPLTRQSRLLQERRTHPPGTDADARAFWNAGLKAYLSRRAFFVLEGRMTFTARPEEVIFRLGFGADF